MAGPRPQSVTCAWLFFSPANTQTLKRSDTVQGRHHARLPEGCHCGLTRCQAPRCPPGFWGPPVLVSVSLAKGHLSHAPSRGFRLNPAGTPTPLPAADARGLAQGLSAQDQEGAHTPWDESRPTGSRSQWLNFPPVSSWRDRPEKQLFMGTLGRWSLWDRKAESSPALMQGCTHLLILEPEPSVALTAPWQSVHWAPHGSPCPHLCPLGLHLLTRGWHGSFCFSGNTHSRTLTHAFIHTHLHMYAHGDYPETFLTLTCEGDSLFSSRQRPTAAAPLSSLQLSFLWQTQVTCPQSPFPSPRGHTAQPLSQLGVTTWPSWGQ